ncbi:MAG TPA: hypothetical protein VJ063_09115 [Verrucomicrobiae bacterium]|nr:hypothetical protein [Verrucomicrobiae bacterium]
MSTVAVGGIGVVSPAGWGLKALRQTLASGTPCAVQQLPRPGLNKPLNIRPVPPPAERPACFQHPRLRRASAITRFAVSAGLEALGKNEVRRLGIVTCVMSGCVQYSRRFYHEVLENPAGASPLLFPETVFNAPGSHLGSVLGTVSINYTLVGDPGTFLQGIALAATWVAEERLDGCLVVGAEEVDWVTSESFRMFDKGFLLAEGAGAIYLRQPRQESEVTLECVTDSHLYAGRTRAAAAKAMQSQLPTADLLVDGTQAMKRYDRPEIEAWSDWDGQRISPKVLLGEGLMAASPWQCITAIDALQQGRCSSALVSIVGCNQQAIGAQFVRA